MRTATVSRRPQPVRLRPTGTRPSGGVAARVPASCSRACGARPRHHRGAGRRPARPGSPARVGDRGRARHGHGRGAAHRRVRAVPRPDHRRPRRRRLRAVRLPGQHHGGDDRADEVSGSTATPRPRAGGARRGGARTAVDAAVPAGLRRAVPRLRAAARRPAGRALARAARPALGGSGRHSPSRTPREQAPYDRDRVRPAPSARPTSRSHRGRPEAEDVAHQHPRPPLAVEDQRRRRWSPARTAPAAS